MSLGKQSARATPLRAPAAKAAPVALLPWDPFPGERRRQYSILAVILLLCVVLILIIEMTPVSRPQSVSAPVPERLAQLVLERTQPPPPPAVSEPEPEVKTESPEPEAEPAPEPPAPAPEPQRPPPTPERVEQARERARQEVQVFQDSLAGLRDIAPRPAAGASAGQTLQRGGSEAIAAQRDLLVGRAGARSGGISTGTVSSRGDGSPDLATAASAQVAQVDSRILAEAAQAPRERQGSAGAKVRTEEQIRHAFDRYAGRINAMYQRALRSNPTLQGTLIIQLVIEPDGLVSAATVASSELHDAELERRVITVIRSMDFGAQEVETWRGDYPINFFPN